MVMQASGRTLRRSRSTHVEVRARADATIAIIEQSRRLLERAAALWGEVAALIDDSRTLIREIYEQQGGRSKLRSISGGSADGLVSDVLVSGAALCVPCIARRSSVPVDEVESILAAIGKTIQVDSAAALCESCLAAGMVFRLA